MEADTAAAGAAGTVEAAEDMATAAVAIDPHIMKQCSQNPAHKLGRVLVSKERLVLGPGVEPYSRNRRIEIPLRLLAFCIRGRKSVVAAELSHAIAGTARRRQLRTYVDICRKLLRVGLL